LFLGVLAAQGCAALEAYMSAPRERLDGTKRDRSRMSAGIRQAFGLLVCGVLLLEYWVAPLQLVRFDNAAPPLYRWLAQLPRGVVAEFPMPDARSLPGYESRYAYMSTFHWMPLINGYSGYYPRVYLRRLEPLSGFPDTTSIQSLRTSGVQYLVIHSGGYSPAERGRIIDGLVRYSTLTYLGDFNDGWGEGTLFRLR
jgi:hypothetical protein